MWAIFGEASGRAGAPAGKHVRTREIDFRALEFGAALHEAMQASAADDPSRHALMIGFTAGLMWRYQDPDDGAEGAARFKVLEGLRSGSNQALRRAHTIVGLVARADAETSYIERSEEAPHYEERVRTLRWLRNFGLRNSRSREDTFLQHDGETDDRIAYDDAGSLEQEAGVLDDVLDLFIAIEPDDILARLTRVAQRSDTGDHEGAVADLTHALDLKPGDVWLHVKRGWAREAAGDAAVRSPTMTRQPSSIRVTRWPTCPEPS